ncbi:MAG: SpoIIE family protein phosphatase, partial [Bacteroidales bacterium]|nr:SpoIIE family protein phosphatase [Bacteroidales bacterium]
MKFKSVQTGVMWVAIAGIVVMFLCLVGYYFYQADMIKKEADVTHKERSILVGRLLTVSTEKFITPIKDNSAWDDLYYAVQKSDTAAIDECVGYMPETYDAEAVAVFDANGTLIYDNTIGGLPDNIYPFDGNELVAFYKDINNQIFTLNIDGRLFNYIGASIVPTDDEFSRKTPPSGYIVLVREMIQNDLQTHCKSLGNIDASIFTDEGAKNEFIKTLTDMDFVEGAMNNFHNEPVAYLCFSYPAPMRDLLSKFAIVFNFIFVEMLLILILVLLYVNRKITLPLKKVSKAFAKNHIAPVLPLTKETNEFGQIANMMVDSFEQKEEILTQNEILSQQKEEIEMQNESLSQQKEEIEAQNEALLQQKEEIEMQNEVLSMQKDEIEAQNEQVLELNTSLTKTNTQMTDSITYASRLQHSMLLAHAPKQGWFADGYAVYKPKLIVGGDFYVAQTLGDYHIAILGDCTGHGVPGAILASMGISFIYQVLNMPDYDFMPDTLLNHMREMVIHAFDVDAEGQQIKDGMDVGVVICNKNTREAYFAGAGRPVIIIRNGEIIEAKGDRMPIGRYIRSNNFTRVPLELLPGDSVYIYSDGCTDQVGGEQRRKITSVKFKQYLAELN